MPNEDGPAGLSTSAVPTGLSALGTGTVGDERELAAEELDDLADRFLRREARGLAVASAPLLARDRGDVDLIVARAQRNAARRPLVARRLANQRDHLRAFDRAQRVDDPLGVRLLGADVAEVVLQEVRDHEAPAFEQLRALECAREQLQLRELHGLIDVLEYSVHVGARFDELSSKPQRLRRRVRVLEASSVGDETDVERGRDLR